MRATLLQGRWSGAEMSPQPEESGTHRVMSRTGNGSAGAWRDPRFLLQIALLLGGLMAIYWTDKSSDRQQLAALQGAAADLSRQATKMESQVASIDGSVRTLTTSLTGAQKDIESLRRDLDALKGQKETTDAWIQSINKAIARLEARAGIN